MEENKKQERRKGCIIGRGVPGSQGNQGKGNSGGASPLVGECMPWVNPSVFLCFLILLDQAQCSWWCVPFGMPSIESIHGEEGATK